MHRLTPDEAGERRDTGAVLVLVLVLTVILGVVACSLAAYASAGLRTSRATDHRTARLSAVDAALRVGGEVLRTRPDRCATAQPSELTRVTVNGFEVAVNCAAILDDADRVGPHELTAVLRDGSTTVTGVSQVQVYTSSNLPCEVAGGRCNILVNSWAIG